MDDCGSCSALQAARAGLGMRIDWPLAQSWRRALLAALDAQGKRR
jgi:hypothetical protein